MIRPPACPICQKTLSLDDAERKRFFPFCSIRCRQVDFFRWVDGRYAIVEPLTGDRMPAPGDGPPGVEDDLEGYE
ncbi:MAG: DNA gyrase inhibitor YacG [Planctomycetaceae bacterium]|nr:DNA gyrase inhibitor YacG [Planctomycetaceae bacterium]